MSTVSSTTRKRIEAQGYLGLSDATLAEVGPWLRFSPAICMVWISIATYYESVTALLVLIPFTALGAILPWHPFDAIYNNGIRHILGTQLLPRAKAPRKFACKVAFVWLCAISWAFYSGATVLGYFLGGSLAFAAAVPTFTDFCVPSFFYGLMFGKPKIGDVEKV
jgi:uncharacterized protein DUF4395